MIQSERQDGEKLVLSMESVENDLPVPVGVNRLKVSQVVCTYTLL